jgi:membrane-bound lytic murein transglycosylase D
VLKHLLPFCIKFLIHTSIMLICFDSCYGQIISHDGIQLFHKTQALSNERKQLLEADIEHYKNAENLWDVLRENFVLPHYEHVPQVREKIAWFMRNQEFLLRSTERAAPYLYFIYEQIKKRKLPPELVLLPIIESEYNPFASSSVGAAGLWQMMPATASGYGIKQDWWYDGRRDIIASTNAALNHLAYLNNFFDGNWLLALAAYDTGEGNLLAAIKRNIRAGKRTDFWSLSVARETQDYVPRLLALVAIISHPSQYPIIFPAVRNAPYLAQIDLNSQVNLKEAAKFAGLSFKRLTELNPGHSRIATAPNVPTQLILPIENIERFIKNSKQNKSDSLRWVQYRVKTGDTIDSIAKKYQTSATSVRKLNQLAARDKLKPGVSLLIPHYLIPLKAINAGKSLLAKNNNNQPIRYNLKPGDTIYMVRLNDSMNAIAKRYHISQQAIREANNLPSDTIQPGIKLVLPTHPHAVPTPVNQAKHFFTGDKIYVAAK